MRAILSVFAGAYPSLPAASRIAALVVVDLNLTPLLQTKLSAYLWPSSCSSSLHSV
jgi:hypothetical protein